MARILVIDDESNIRMMLRLALTHVGHEVETAGDGYEGLERFGDGAGWDLVLLDQRMPGIEGLEVLREMRLRHSASRIVMITAFGTIDLATEAMVAGASQFLRKPFTVETLRNTVTTALTDAPIASSPIPVPLNFDKTAVNGFRLVSVAGVTFLSDGGISDTFTVTMADETQSTCRVNLPPYLVELVKAHSDREALPGGEAFWEALCGEALANYLWQNAELPPGNMLLLDDLTTGLRHWMDAVLSSKE